MPAVIGVGIIAVAAHVASGCSSCNREGCEKMHERASSNGTSALAGAVAAESDVVENGCAECALASTELDIWNTSTLVEDEGGAQSIVSSAPPAFSLSARGTYRQALPAGSYLVCARECVAVAVEPRAVTTLNILMVYGPTSYRLFDPGASDFRTAPSFRVTR